MSEMTGTCMFCGQQVIVEAETQEKADELATEKCSCENDFRKMRKMIDNIEKICGEEAKHFGMEIVDDNITDSIKDIGILCIGGQIEAATVRLTDSTVALKKTKEGIAVSRKKVLSAKLES